MPRISHSKLLLVSLSMAGCDGCSEDVDSAEGGALGWDAYATVNTANTAFAVGGDTLLVAGAEGLERWRDGEAPVIDDGLPSGAIHFLGALPGDPPVFLAEVEGRGLYRDGGEGWEPVSSPPSSSLLGMLSDRARTVPFGLDADPDAPGEAWIAATGGIFHSDDHGDTWTQIPIDTGFNLMFTDVAVQGDRVVATAFRPAGILPSAYQDLLTGHVFVSDDGGQSWDDGDPELGFRYPAAVDIGPDGRAWIAAMDGGLFAQEGEGWSALGGPSDAVGVEVDAQGVSVISATRGPWRLEGETWTSQETASRAGPMVGLAEGWALAEGGALFVLAEGAGEPALEPGGATVHIALSFHTNLYHSYRGDSNSDDGYGIDLDVMRAELDWLDERPQVHADWDIENHFSLDGWLATDGADVLERIQARVASGQDGVRPMSWNNGAVSAQTREEFDASIAWAQDSLEAAFGGFDPGVQPQECMFTPEHIGWYRDLGIEWITMFYSGTPFTALRQEISLPSDAWYAPVTVQHGQDSMTLVPAYHHGDLIDHGGLAGWAQQIHDSQAGDQLLLIHFDADAESWEAFHRELDALEGLDFVEFTTIQDHLDSHDPALTITGVYDMADGTGDGWQSWAEKLFNHEIATGIATARETAAQAAALAEGDPEILALLDEALVPRLLALSTTHFGLAAPFLHEDRQASARAYTSEANEAATAAMREALALAPPAPGSISVLNTRDAAGAALVEFVLRVPDEWYEGLDGLHLYDEAGQELAASVTLREKAEDFVAHQVALVLELEAKEERSLSWDYDASTAPATGEASLADLLQPPLAPPFTECAGEASEASAGASVDPSLDDRGAYATRERSWDLSLCDAAGSVTWTEWVYEGLPGTVIKVSGSMGQASDPEDAESVALSPITCEGPAQELTWRTFGGAEQTRPVRQEQWSWNGQAVDGWVELGCQDRDIQVSHRVTERTSLAFAPLRTVDGAALLAPMGTLWGDPVRHDARRTGGHGMGDVAVGLIGSQFSPAAPDWSGQSVSYRLLLGEDIDPGTLDLFAHPPLVRVGGSEPAPE
jgi:hypothetical protein